MNPFFIGGSDVIKGIDFLFKILESNSKFEYDSILYYNITERDIMFYDDGEGERHLKNLNTLLTDKNINLYLILSSVPQEYYDTIYTHSNISVIHNPFYFISYLLTECGETTWHQYRKKYTLLRENSAFDKMFITLNSRGHYYRCMLIDSLEKNQLLDYSVYSWNEIVEPDYYKFKFWKQEKTKLNSNISKYNCLNILENNPLIHLVSESEISHISFSEKVFKPILIGSPFIVLGAKGFHKKLEEYGFELYTEIFDYSFDACDNLQTRIDGICDNLNRLKNIPYDDIINLVYDKTIKNIEHAYSIFKNKKFIPLEMYDISEKFLLVGEKPFDKEQLKTYLY